MSTKKRSIDQTSDSLPYKVVDSTRQTKYGVVASSYQDLIDKAGEKFGTSFTKVLLEEDGTIADAEYFETLPANTCLMLLKNNEEWVPVSHSYFQNTENQDLTDGVNNPRLVEILTRLRNDISYLPLLRIEDLELLTEMDVDSFGDIPDKKFLELIQEASIRFLNDKRDAKDAIDALRFLKTYYPSIESNSK
ncbi:DNA fragmentation factor subunit alpha-like [Planococcus citri]|uniref:DNA fragmentation factor subunit alpha-like n=1 Tax=Planococcus citri TaxID=170843 RepID=UPI0031F7F427